MTSSYDAMIVGGGLAGASLAISLAQAGRHTLLLEKSISAHPKVCGEFLSQEALHYLAALEIDLQALGAVPIGWVRLAGNKLLATSRLPFASLSLSRERLDEALLQQAGRAGVSVERGRRVQSLERCRDHWIATTQAGETLTAKEAFLATGKHDLHGWNRPPGRQNDLIAFKMYWRLSAGEQRALSEHVELVLFPGGYAGLQPVEQGRANLCLLVRKQEFRRAGGSWAALLAHMQHHSTHLAARLAGAAPLWERPLSLSSIPYGYVRAQADGGPWRLGDQSAVIPSFAGDGMSIALHSAALAAQLYCAGGSGGAEQYQQRLAQDISHQVRLAARLSGALVRQPRLVAALAGLWPGVLAPIATSTRIRTQDLL